MGIGEFVGECKRVFKVTKKPSKTEYQVIVKASGIGILILGGLGFIIHIILTFVPIR